MAASLSQRSHISFGSVPIALHFPLYSVSKDCSAVCIPLKTGGFFSAGTVFERIEDICGGIRIDSL